MKFSNVDPHNLSRLVPEWAMSQYDLARYLDAELGRLYSLHPKLKPKKWHQSLRFWIEVLDSGDSWRCEIKTPTSSEDKLRCGQLFIDCPDWVVCVPINPFLKGADPVDGRHSLYLHAVMTETPLVYVGITKHAWHERYAQHLSSANRGSNLLFHRALREHERTKKLHRAVIVSIDHESAMRMEEEWVGMFSLYPLGLNMIPGGNAGLRYLSKLGVMARTASERDAALEEIVEQKNIGEKPNPLCAARWSADQDYVNRVICGHSGRLTVDQVRKIRALLGTGRAAPEVASMVGDKVSRVKAVEAGEVYARVA